MKIKWIVALLLVVTLAVSCATARDFSNVVNKSVMDTYINSTSIQTNSNQVPIADAIWIGSLGIVLLLLSFILSAKQNNDIVALMASGVLFISITRFLSVDMVYSGVAASHSEETEATVFAMLVQHEQMVMYPEAILFVALFIISIFNIYKIITTNRRENEENDGVAGVNYGRGIKGGDTDERD